MEFTAFFLAQALYFHCSGEEFHPVSHQFQAKPGSFLAHGSFAGKGLITCVNHAKKLLWDTNPLILDQNLGYPALGVALNGDDSIGLTEFDRIRD